MTIKEFWKLIEDKILTYGECDGCPVNSYAVETNTEPMCNKVGDCADTLKLLHKKLQEEEREKQDSLNELPW